MANLKAIAIRLKSVKNIQKITQSMKMVSAAKYSRAERDLKAAKPYGEGAQAFYKSAEVGTDAEGNVKAIEGPAGAAPKELFVALTSDRGLCGGVHSSICKTIRNELLEKSSLENVGIICVGDKSRAQLARYEQYVMRYFELLQFSTFVTKRIFVVGCSLRISFALALKSVVCLPNSEMLPKLPAQL